MAGEFSFQFFVYDVPVGGVPVWTETHDGTALPRIKVVNGLLSTVLGQAVPLDATVLDPSGAGDRYVAVELAGDELCRVKLTATAFAVSATVANGLWNPVTSTSLDAQALDDRYVDTDEVEALVPAATVDVAGKVVLAAHDATTAGAAVQGSDPRLEGIRVSANGGAPTSRRAQVNLIAGPNLTISAADDSGNGEVDVTIAATIPAEFVALSQSASGSSKTVTVPGGTLAVDGEALHIWASGDAAGGANLKLQWGTVDLIPTLSSGGGFEGDQTWVVTGYLIRTGGSEVIATFHVTVAGQDASTGSQREEWVQARLRVSTNFSQARDVIVSYVNPAPGSLVNVLRVRKER